MDITFFIILVAAAAFLATRQARSYSIRTQMLDIPGERSSHDSPTPRGGGAGFVAVVLAGGAALFIHGDITINVLYALCGGGGAVAVIGWLDDRKSRSARIRFAVHCCAGLWALLWLGVPEWLPLGRVFFFLAIVWLINSYNFMDGIDGIAAGEAAAAGFAGAALSDAPAAGLCLLAAAAALGFLPWNWPKAKIFMGDVGSGFLGFVFALAWLADAGGGGGGFYTLPIILGAFIADSTITLLWRMAHGQKWYAAHRLHAYQVLAARHGHRAVTLAYLGVTLFWLAPMAWAARGRDGLSLCLAAAAYAPPVLGVAWVHVRGGHFR